MSDTVPTYHPAPSRPQLRLPAGACDTHCHIFGPQSVYPYPPEASFRPVDAPREKLFALHELLGIERCVIVQSGCHGFDNAVVLDAMAARPGRYLGVVLLPVNIDDATLADYASRGVRGVRFNFMPHLAADATPDQIVACSAQLAEHGMHLQVHMMPSLIKEVGTALRAAHTPVVIDHMGRVDASLGLEQEPFQDLLLLMEDEKFFVKVSGSERSSRMDYPYSDALPFARTLVERFPDRVLWGTDWPHPNFAGEIPDDGKLIDLLGSIAPTSSMLQALMVDNPARFYRFEEQVL